MYCYSLFSLSQRGCVLEKISRIFLYGEIWDKKELPKKNRYVTYTYIYLEFRTSYVHNSKPEKFGFIWIQLRFQWSTGYYKCKPIISCIASLPFYWAGSKCPIQVIIDLGNALYQKARGILSRISSEQFYSWKWRL